MSEDNSSVGSDSSGSADSAAADVGSNEPASQSGDGSASAEVSTASDAVAAAVAKIKIKGIDGAEKEYTPDEINAIVKRARDIESGAHQKMSKSAQQMKALSAFVDELRSNPINALRKIGHDPDSLSEQHLASRLEELSIPEDQRRLKSLERENEILKEQFEARERAAAEQKNEAVVNAARERHLANFSTALAAVGMTVDPAAAEDRPYFEAMASIILANRQEIARGREIGVDVPTVSIEDAARQVLNAEIRRASRALSPLKGEELVKALGDRVATELKVAKLPTQPGGRNPVAKLNEALGVGQHTRKVERKMTQEEFRNSFR
jgi:DNA-binding transcriptional ArsR family regulator